MTAVYLAAFIVGGVSVLTALLLADVGHGDGMPFLSLTGIWGGLGTVPTALLAGASALGLAFVLNGALLPYLRKQQANSHRGRSSYIGLLGTVTLEVPAGGWGEVSFVDADGNRVFSRAKSDEPAPLPKSTRVYIADIDADSVHVVAVPEP